MPRRPLSVVAACAALGLGVGCAAREFPPACSVGIRQVSVLDVDAGGWRNDQTVVVCGDRITFVQTGDPLVLPTAARWIDGRGRFLIPGLWDAHAHAFAGDFGEWLGPLMLANGVTSIRDMGFYPDTARHWRREVAAGRAAGPRIVASLRIDGPQNRTPWVRTVADSAVAVRAVRDARAARMDFVKVYSHLSRNAYFSAAAEAGRIGLPFGGHVPFSVTVEEAIAAGQRTIEHEDDLMRACSTADGQLRAELSAADPRAPAAAQLALVRRQAIRMRDERDDARCARIATLLALHNTALTPTLVVYQPYAHDRAAGVLHPERDRYVSAAMKRSWQARLSRVTPEDTLVAGAYFSLARTGMLHRSGVTLLAGTDTPLPYVVPGFSVHDELRLLVDAGLTPLEAIRAATRAPARTFGVPALGTIAVEAPADLLLLDADPLADLAHLRDIRAVVASGRLYDRAALDALLDRAARAAAR